MGCQYKAPLVRQIQSLCLLGILPGLVLGATNCIKSPNSAALAKEGVKNPINVELAAERNQRAFAILSDPNKQNDQSMLEEAASYALSASELAPGNAGHYFLAGLIYEKLSAKDSRALTMAEQMFERSVEIDPEYTAAWLEIGLMMASQSRGMEAIQALEKALACDPQATAQYALGPLCAMYAANDEAVRGLDFFQEEFEKNPEVTALGIGSSLMFYCLGDRQAALSRAQDLLLIEPAGSAEHDYLCELVAEWEKEKP